MATQIQVRRDSAADWTSNDPTLAEGEIGYETDTGYLKIGDGATAWTSLAYSAKFSDSNPEDIGATASAGTDDASSRADHVHGVEAGDITNPLISNSGTITDYTGITVHAKYVKIGTLVQVEYSINSNTANLATATGSGGSGALKLTLPYTGAVNAGRCTAVLYQAGGAGWIYNGQGALGTADIALFQADTTAFTSSTTSNRIITLKTAYITS